MGKNGNPRTRIALRKRVKKAKREKALRKYDFSGKAVGDTREGV